jgi:hypothetical protein
MGALAADQAHAAIVQEPLRRARAALDRAKALDHTGDARHAAVARAAAREWVDVARDLIRAVDAESRATESEKKLDELETKVIRGRALLEETVARRGRAAEALEQMQRTPSSPEVTKGSKKEPAASDSKKDGVSATPSPQPRTPAPPPHPDTGAPVMKASTAPGVAGPAKSKGPAPATGSRPAPPQP